MLSRTADHLYWMARYNERAENVARMLDVNFRMSLFPQAPEQIEQGWGAVLGVCGLQDAYSELHGSVTPEKVVRYMVFERDNPSSIYSCLYASRENIRAVRGSVTAEMWETQNASWLEFREMKAETVQGSDIGEIFEWVRHRSHLSRGVTVGTMLQDEGFRFIRLGSFLERADNTARILDVKYQAIELGAKEGDASSEYYQWSALLRSVSGFAAYRKVYSDLITPLRVVELLVLRADMPRSLARSMKEVYTNLCLVANSHSGETVRRAGELHSSLRFGRIEDIFDVGLHDYLTAFLGKTNDLGNRIAQDFLVPMVAD